MDLSPNTLRRKTEIKARAEYIRSKLKDGRFYGAPIDMDDPNEVLVAAYFMGQTDWYTQHKPPEFP